MVIGGGIAGTAAALAVAKAGFDVSVYEAHPASGADIGAFLTLADNGMRALAQIDAADAVAGRGFPLTAMAVLDHTGAEITSVPLGGHDDPLTNYRCMRRAELADVLRAEAVRRGIPIRQGARLASLTEDEHGVTLRFTDGSTATGDIAIGADGLDSTTRSLIDPGPPRYAGQHVWYGYSTAAQPPTTPERITMIRGCASAFGYCVSPFGETFWFARTSAAEPLSADEITTATPDQLLPLLSNDTTPAYDIVAATGDRLMVTNASDLAPGIRWHTEATVLIGDAAHAASPATGQGASMALEDAVVLAKALRDSGGTIEALRCYDELRRPRVERNIEVSAAATAGRPRDQGPHPSRVDDELAGVLDWQSRIHS